MKRNLFLLLVCMACTSVSFAQMINSNGKIGIGTFTPNASHKTTIDGSLLMKFGPEGGLSGTYEIVSSTGSPSATYVDISPFDKAGSYPIFQYTLGQKNRFQKGVFDFVHYNYALINSSDERLKRNINALSFDRKSFSLLKPVSYEITDAWSIQKAKDKQEEPFYTSQYGFLAQELQEVYPQLVLKDEETGYLRTKPLEMIPILVAALQDQQKQIDNQQKQINELKQLAGTKSELRSSEEIGDVTGISSETITNKVTLYQNVPNPFNQSTEIRYYIPENSQSAQLCIYNLQGNQIKQIVVAERGESSYLLSASELTAGMYLYTLIIDGKEIDTKRMILTE